MKYIVVVGFMSSITDTLNRRLFEQRVQAHIDEGWEPRGGVSMTTDRQNDICLSQALVHK